MKGVIIMKNERILRFVCSFLTAIMLLSSLAACAETKPSEETTAAENNAGTLVNNRLKRHGIPPAGGSVSCTTARESAALSGLSREGSSTLSTPIFAIGRRA